MNKFIFAAVLLTSFAPAVIFAASDYSWGMSQQGTSHQGGGMGAGKMEGSGVDSGMMMPPPRPPMGDESDMDRPPRPPMGSGGMMNHNMPPRPPMGSGTMMEHEAKGLMLAIGALSPADRATLVKMIQDYLVSKGIDPAKYAEKREEMKDIRKETHQEIKDIRQTGRDAAKIKREEMKAKIETLRGHGKVNVQDISMTRNSGMGAGKVNVQDISLTGVNPPSPSSDYKKDYVGHVTLIKQ